MSGSRTILKNSFLGYSGIVLSQLLLLIFFAALARGTEPAEFGSTIAIYGLITLAADICDFGTSARTVRDVASGAVAPETLARFRSIRCWVGAAQVTGWVVASVVLPQSGVEMALWGLVVGARLLASSYAAIRQAAGEFSIVAISMVTDRLVSLICLSTALWAGWSVGSAVPASLLLGCSVGAWLVRPSLAAGYQLAQVRLRDVRAYLSFGSHYAASILVTDLLFLDVVLVALISGSEQAGYLSIGSRLAGPIVMLSGAVSIALVPVVARTRDTRGLRSLLVAVVLSNLVLVGAVVLAADLLVRTIFGSAFVEGVDVVRIYMAGAMLSCIAQPIAAILQSLGAAKDVSVVLALGVAVNLAAICVGSWLDGAHGAAWGFFISNVVVMIGFLLALRRTRSRVRSESDALSG